MWIEIFRSGTHRDSAGNTHTYTDDMLDEMAELYNSKIIDEPAVEAPLVKGHPKSNDPAYGWIKRLARRGRILMAELKKLTPEVINDIREGKFRNVSIALYPDKMLRHVGLLGAAAPAVKGLQPVTFAEDEDFSEFINPGNEESFITINSGEFTGLNEKLTALELENSRLNDENSGYKTRINELQREARLKEFREFADSLIENPKGAIITPAQAENLVDILEMAFAADNGASLEFSDNNINLSKVKEFMLGLQPVFSLNEFATRSNARELKPINDFSNKKVSKERMKLHEKAKQLQSEFPEMDYEEAVVSASRI